MVGSEREPDHEVVEAEHQAAQDQPQIAARRLVCRLLARSPGAPDRVNDRIGPNPDKQACADPARGVTKVAGDLRAEQQTENWHP